MCIFYCPVVICLLAGYYRWLVWVSSVEDNKAAARLRRRRPCSCINTETQLPTHKPHTRDKIISVWAEAFGPQASNPSIPVVERSLWYYS